MKNEKISIFQPDPAPLHLTFLILSGASLMCVASAIDPLRAANRVTGRTLFDWSIISTDGASPLTSSDMPIAGEGAFKGDESTDVLVIIGGFGARLQTTPALLAQVRRVARSATAVCGVEAGTWLLGRAGLLEGRTATTHWEDLEDFATRFPGCDVRPDRYVIDGPIITAGGASPVFDLMLHLIRTRHGMAVALDVASVFIYDQARAATDAQPLVSLGRLDGYNPRIVQAIRLMESHIDLPLTTAAVAVHTGVTTRTLEKIFKAAVGETPGAYYLRLRLNSARRLVVDTAEPMAYIAARTGFSSAAVFSRAFTKAFGQSPMRTRIRWNGTSTCSDATAEHHERWHRRRVQH